MTQFSELMGTAMRDADEAAEAHLSQLEYSSFLDQKTQLGGNFGFKPLWIPPALFDFQEFLSDWTIKGRAELMTDCGTGKTPMQLTWARSLESNVSAQRTARFTPALSMSSTTNAYTSWIARGS